MVRGLGWRQGASLAALAVAIAISATAAQAGSFGIREQSTYYQGMSFAGEAVGNDLSSMFWNPAATASFNGINSSSNFTGVFADSQIHATGGAFVSVYNMGTESGNIADPGVVPASYFNYQVNDRLYLGLALNSPYAFTTKPDNVNWAGSPIATSSKVFSLNATPTVAYKLTPTLTVGAGVQIQYFDVTLKSGPAGGPITGRTVEGDDVGLGATAGIIWKPAHGTQIGIGYRSAVDISLDGRCTGRGLTNASFPVACGTGTDVTADLTLPDVVSFGLRQSITKDVAFMGTVEWTRWSSLGTVNINNSSGTTVDVLPLDYEDGWLISGGLEYAHDQINTFRTGIGWEKSPITDQTRKVFLPDANRWWLSVGSSHKLSDKMTLDLAYTHIIVDDASIVTSNVLVAEAESKVNIVSAAVKYKWGGSEPELEPLK